ncbi:MAG: hypothetical protein WDO18_19875 [Acidobacteriota bacterium]
MIASGQTKPAPPTQKAFINRYCVGCHNDKTLTAGLSLQNVNLTDVTQSGEVLEKVVRKVRTRRHAAGQRAEGRQGDDGNFRHLS